MATSSLPAPSFVAAAPQRTIAEPLAGSREVFYYLSNFPDEIYTKSPDTNLYALMRAILGEGGVNFMAKQFYQARELVEEMGLDVTDLDNFFADPFGFSRNAQETYTVPTTPVISQVEQQIRSSDASYFSRAVNYINGARAGNTPLGMQKVAEAGLGYGAEIIENYQFLYDQHSDAPLGLPYFGQTLSPNEFIVLPQAEISSTQVIELTIQGSVTGGTINFGFGRGNQPTIIPQNSTWTTQSTTYPVSPNASINNIANALAQIPNIGAGNANVSGNPGGPFYISFQGDIDVNSIQLLNVYNNLQGTNVTIYLNTLYGFLDANQEIINITSQDAYTLFSALDNIRPVNTFVTVSPNSGVYNQVLWNNVYGSSEYSEVLRFVTGNASITWPSNAVLAQYWIQSSQEIQAPRIFKDVYYNYQGWHNITGITSSTIGTTAIQPSPNQLGAIQTYPPIQAVANYAEPLFITSSESGSTQGIDSYLNRIYPIEYENIPGAPSINYTQQYWLSQPGTGTEWLIIELGTPQAMNYLTFDIIQNPIQVDVFYDTFDHPTEMNFVQITPILPYFNVLTATTTNNPIASMALTFSNSLQEIIFSRRLQILFTRLNGYAGTIQVANLRVGRNVAS